ncbi:MAG: 3-oxoacyl-[acyl-carrier-protein] synthase III C-terminal domain-containing protein [Gammaproteobacteria bacterium]
MFIKSVKSLTPGEKNNQFGRLIPTIEILERMSAGTDEKFKPTFLQRMIGIESIAATNDSISCLEKEHYQPRNKDIYSALEQICKEAIQEVKDNFPITYHIHICGPQEPTIEHALGTIRRNLGINGLYSIIIQQGCAGILDAIELSKKLLMNNENLLITCENNTIPYIHNRKRKYATTKNINDWLWISMLGDSVGAMILSKNTLQPALEITHIHKELATDEWRVKEYLDEQSEPVMRMRAKEVRQTYLNNVTKHASTAIEKSDGLDKVAYVLLHESNPKMVKEVAVELGIPEDKLVIKSHKTGTIGAVSSFSLLAGALDTDSKISSDRNKIILVCLGESPNGISSGFLNCQFMDVSTTYQMNKNNACREEMR